MTKQDYIKLANLIKDSSRNSAFYGDIILKDKFINELIPVLKSNNPRFNEETFRKACEY
jgi:hypothetical protein